MLMCNTHMKWAILYMYITSAFLCDDCNSYTNNTQVHVIFGTCNLQFHMQFPNYKWDMHLQGCWISKYVVLVKQLHNVLSLGKSFSFSQTEHSNSSSCTVLRWNYRTRLQQFSNENL